MKRAIAPHITVQPISGNATTKLTAPIIGTKIINPITTIIITPTIQGFKQRLHELNPDLIGVKNLFIVKSYTF